MKIPIPLRFRRFALWFGLLAVGLSAASAARAADNRLWQFYTMEVPAPGSTKAGILYVGPVFGAPYEELSREQDKFLQRVRRFNPQGPFRAVKRQGEGPYNEGKEGMQRARDEFIDGFLKKTHGKGVIHEI